MALEYTGAASGAAGGAAAGAVVGSVIPGLGTAAGAIIGGAYGAITGFFGGSSKEKAIRAQREASLEVARREAYRNQLTLGSGIAAAAASGVEQGGSMATYLNAMAAEFRRQNTMNVRAANKGAVLQQQAGIWDDMTSITNSAFQAGMLFMPRADAGKKLFESAGTGVTASAFSGLGFGGGGGPR